jgi:hypothetical protein
MGSIEDVFCSFGPHFKPGFRAPVAEVKVNLFPSFCEPRELVMVGVDRDSAKSGTALGSLMEVLKGNVD